MWQFLAGFGMGVYIGTIYDCKPTVSFVRDCLKKTIPENALPIKKVDDDESKSN